MKTFKNIQENNHVEIIFCVYTRIFFMNTVANVLSLILGKSTKLKTSSSSAKIISSAHDPRLPQNFLGDVVQVFFCYSQYMFLGRKIINHFSRMQQDIPKSSFFSIITAITEFPHPTIETFKVLRNLSQRSEDGKGLQGVF